MCVPALLIIKPVILNMREVDEGTQKNIERVKERKKKYDEQHMLENKKEDNIKEPLIVISPPEEHKEEYKEEIIPSFTASHLMSSEFPKKSEEKHEGYFIEQMIETIEFVLGRVLGKNNNLHRFGFKYCLIFEAVGFIISSCPIIQRLFHANFCRN